MKSRGRLVRIVLLLLTFSLLMSSCGLSGIFGGDEIENMTDSDVVTDSSVEAEDLTPVDIPQGNTYVYSGKSISLSSIIPNCEYYTLSGTYEATDAGEYTVILEIAEGYCWSDGTVGVKSVSWKIEPKSVEIPEGKTYNYTGRKISLENIDRSGRIYTVSGTYEAQNEGVYNAILTLNSNYRWSDGTDGAKTVSWAINRKTDIPEGKEYAYNGREVALDTIDLSGRYYTVSGTYRATAAGEYSVTLTPTDVYFWPDGTTDAKTIIWRIIDVSNRESIEIPESKSYTYSGEMLSLDIDTTGQYYTLNGTYQATDAGTYTVSLIPTENYRWSDGTIEKKTLTLSIERKQINTPQSRTFKYNGRERYLSLDNSGEYYAIDGTYRAVEVGLYTVTLTLTNNYCWSDGTIDPLTLSLTIEEAKDLDSLDLGGRVFKMLWPEYTSDGHFKHNELGIAEGAEAFRGDIIEIAIYERNLAVELLYNANIEVTTERYSDIISIVGGSVMAGHSDFDAVSTMNTKMSKLALEGFLVDFNDLQYYSEEQQWWNHELMQELSIVNRRYFGVGDIIYSDDLYTNVIYVNIDVADQVGLTDDFYDLVDNKQWTLETFHRYAKSAVLDCNDDGVISMYDDFGAVGSTSFARALYYSAGRGLISYDSQGYPVLVSATHLSTVFDRIVDIWHSNSAVVDVTALEGGSNLDSSDIINMFDSGQILFMPETLKTAQTLHSTATIDYAILPIPLWEDDSEYRSVMDDTMVISIPITVREQDEVGLILSAMGRASVDTLTPAFYELILTGRYMNNVDSVATLELILESAVPRDVADVQGWGGFMNGFCSLAIEGYSDGIVSYYAARENLIRVKIEEYMAALEILEKY